MKAEYLMPGKRNNVVRNKIMARLLNLKNIDHVQKEYDTKE